MKTKWSWVKGGIILGILNIIVFLSGNRLGTTSAYNNTVGKLAEFFSPATVERTFLQQPGGCGAVAGHVLLQVNWQWMLVFGVLVGAWLARRVGREGPAPAVPSMWRQAFGGSNASRFLAAFVGGLLLLFGARMAGGCTSGHIISGISRLGVSGLVFGIMVFAGGIPTALAIYHGKGSD